MKSISIIIPAFNEEDNLAPTVEKILLVCPQYYCEYELVIYNDGSTDKTAHIADELSHQYNCVKVIHNQNSKNLGWIFKDGCIKSQSDYIVMIHGQNDILIDSLHLLFSTSADVVIPYQVNTFERAPARAILSKTFVILNNLFFKMNLNYYNHYVLFKRDAIRGLNELSSSYAFQAEILIKTLQNKEISYVEIPFVDDFSNKVKSSAFTGPNIYGVVKYFIKMIKEMYFE